MAKESLRVLQIGAGSMGQRRLRDLKDREDVELALFELRADRRDRGLSRNEKLRTFSDLDEALAWGPDALSISTPPQAHDEYVRLALERGVHHFCEANIWTMDPEWIEQLSESQSVISAPSSSLYFLPAVQEMSRIVRDELGGLHGYQMALNTYMPDWHPEEGPEYYARHRNTAAGREMVPFELLWLNHVFREPVELTGLVTRGGSLPGIMEDTWSLQMRLEGGIAGQLIVLMGCPGALRQGWCFGEAGQVFFDLFSGEIRREYRKGVRDSRNFGAMKDVLEATYSREINTFIDAVHGKARWPQSYRASAVATATLAAAERSAELGERVSVDVGVQPKIHPDVHHGSAV
jgi:predicted dehydrogenase